MRHDLGRRPRVVFVDDDPGLLRLLTIRLKAEGYDVAACPSAAQAITAIPRFRPDVVLTDLRMAEMDGIGLLRELQRRHPTLPVILLSAHGTIPDAVDATKSGAFSFLTKPVDKAMLLEQLDRALRISGFAATGADWRAGIISRNPGMEEQLAKALQASGTEAPVLISGQPGTGKKYFARAIHEAGRHAPEGLQVLSCALATEAELLSMLREPPAGKAEGVAGGTLLLDEIADLDWDLQTRLAGLLESPASVPRLISLTSRNLSAAISKSLFREDLYYRLGVMQIDLPALNQRRDDIPLLATHFLNEFPDQKSRRVLAPEAQELLARAEWPGNVAQLRNLVHQAVALSTSPVISAEIIQQALGGGGASRVATFDEARDEFTRGYLVQLLQITRGNVTQAAKLAGRNRTDFYKLLSRHQLQPEEFKNS